VALGGCPDDSASARALQRDRPSTPARSSLRIVPLARFSGISARKTPGDGSAACPTTGRPPMRRRFVIASMLHETNTFSPLSTPITSFGPGGPLRGERAVAELGDTNYGIGGFIGLAREAGAEFTVPIAAHANPSGLVTREAYETMTG